MGFWPAVRSKRQDMHTAAWIGLKNNRKTSAMLYRPYKLSIFTHIFITKL